MILVCYSIAALAAAANVCFVINMMAVGWRGPRRRRDCFAELLRSEYACIREAAAWLKPRIRTAASCTRRALMSKYMYAVLRFQRSRSRGGGGGGSQLCLLVQFSSSPTPLRLCFELLQQ